MSGEAVTLKPPPPPPGAVYYNGKLPSYLTQKKRSKRRRRGCSCDKSRCCFTSMCSTLIGLIVVIGILALVFWVVYRPKSPRYTIDSVRIMGLDTKSLNTSTTIGTVNAETTFNVVARNPNQKLGFIYKNIDIDIEVLGVSIGSGSLPSFSQGKKNTTTIAGDFKSGPININDFPQGQLVSASKANKVPAVFKVDVKAQVKIGSWKSWKFKVKASCTVSVNPTSKIPTGTTDEKCSSKFHMW
jgi:hypothetical protein